MKKYLPLLSLLVIIVAVGATLLPPRNPSDFDVNGFGRLPVLLNGRIKPYDTVARTSLLVIQNKQTVITPDGRTLRPIEWLLDTMFNPALSDQYQIFVVDDPDLLALLNLRTDDGRGGRRFSYAQMQPAFAQLDNQAKMADQVETQNRSRFNQATIRLRDSVVLYQRLKYSLVPPGVDNYLNVLLNWNTEMPKALAAVQARQAGEDHGSAAAEQMLQIGQSFVDMSDMAYLLAVPPEKGAVNQNDWQSAGEVLVEMMQGRPVDPSILAFAGLAQTWRQGQAAQFNELVRRFGQPFATRFPTDISHNNVETRFNAAQPFITGMVLFVFALLAGVGSWLVWPDTLRRIGFQLISVAWLLTTVGIAVRMWLEGRPPVTNLYSSALFVGWLAVGLCVVLEWIYRNAVGSVAAATIGFGTLLIAHHLSYSGDTMEMMRAVLDSNFWLATHVVAVTAGYGATYLAGFLALIYVIRGVFTRSLDKPTADSLTRMVYGIVCFATLFSFVGTVLGGIWADQSWGRFWGWDPKENGALIIVLWNAIILHARWGGLVRARGLMSLAIGGNIVTSWSWWGVNMLGVGLHSYGFTNAAFFWLTSFVASQLVLIGVASLPLNRWRSFRPPAPGKQASNRPVPGGAPATTS